MNESVSILGVRIDNVSLNQMIQKAIGFAKIKKHSRIMYGNVHVINNAYKNKRLLKILNEADLVYCDGAGVTIGTRILGKRIWGRMTGADWIYNLSSACESQGISLFFLGSKNNIAENAREMLQKKFPALKIVGVGNGFEDANDKRIIDKINKSEADILLVGMGTPIQEFWVEEHFENINVPVIWTVGALFDFVSNSVIRGPRWMLDNGMEWLFRLFVEPSRMWRRYLIGNFNFILRVLIQRISEGKK